ncbi:MAG: endonuclease/exonuclease/phosphatase family protein [Candidatus Hydrogenedentes bacterium]|nr:endonuclease/exonuclease/phosphatase family protein [Candidatus Hydrogenedentota bacterium]
MLRPTTLCCLLAAFAAFPTLPAHAAPLDLKIMSFNVRYGTAKDGENAWEKRKEVLTRAIQSEDPDLLGLQECLLFQAGYIVSQLPNYQWLGMGREATGGGETTVILYKKEHFSPLKTGTFWLSETPEVPGSKSWDSSLPRIATWARFLHGPSGATFYHFNTHFDHRGQEARKQSGILLAAKAASIVQEKEPVLLTGDFNSTDDESPWKALSDGGFKDAWRTAPQLSGTQGTFGGFGAPKEDGARIDWVLYMGDVTAKRCASLGYSENGRFPSDHVPVVADLTLHP